MKKLISIFLTFCFVVTLTGCSSKKNDDDILKFFNALDKTMDAKSIELKGDITLETPESSIYHIDAQLNQQDSLQLAITLGLEANGNKADDYLDFYIKDGKTYLNNMGTKTQSVASNIGIDEDTKLSAYNPFLSFTDEELTDFFESSSKDGNTYTYEIDPAQVASLLDSLGTVSVDNATVTATIEDQIIKHLIVSCSGTQSSDSGDSANFSLTANIEVKHYNSLDTVTFPDDLDSYEKTEDESES